MVDAASIPDELKQRPQWVVWRYEHGTKVPYNARTGGRASSTNATTWVSFEAAQREAQRNAYDGIGYVFDAADPYAGIDLDDCVDGDTIAPWAAEILDTLQSYSEISPSGEGIKVWVKGVLPSNIGATRYATGAIELYDRTRYFTVTGRQVPGTPAMIRDVNGALTELHATVKAARETQRTPTPPVVPSVTLPTPLSLADRARYYTNYAHKALRNEVRKVREAIDGTKHDRIRDSAMAVAGFIHTGGITAQEIETEIYAAVMDRAKDKRGALEAIRAGIGYGIAKPREIPDPPEQPALCPGVVSDDGVDAAEAPAPYTVVTVDENLAQADTNLIWQCLHEEEYGDARLLAHLYTGRLVFDHTESAWYLWAGHAWQRDDTDVVKRLIAGQVASQYIHLAAETTKQAEAQADKDAAAAKHKQVTKLMERARALRKLQRTKNVLGYAMALMGITGRGWDADAWLLGVPNGVVDLRSGQLRDGRPEDYIRTVCPTAWAGLTEAAPRWERFLFEVFNDSADHGEIVGFLHRLFGYGVSGSTQEHVFPILWGDEGRNGKDTLLETLSAVLGPLAGPVTTDVVVAAKAARSPGGPTPHLYELRGKRIVWANETDKGARIDAAQIKQITGGGQINARTLHSRPVSFLPTHLLCLVTNDRPHAPADDKALWERVILVPFSLRFVNREPVAPNERRADPNLRAKLRAEASGVLAWLVRGCLLWQAGGSLAIPDALKAATSAYQQSEDTVGLFLEDTCMDDAEATVPAGELYMKYTLWCDENGLRRMNQLAFKEKMEKRYERKRRGAGWMYFGLRLLTDADVPTDVAPATSFATDQHALRTIRILAGQRRFAEAKAKVSELQVGDAERQRLLQELDDQEHRHA